MRTKAVIVLCLLCGFLAEASAQTFAEKLRSIVPAGMRKRGQQVDSMLTARYYRTPYDTNYVVRPVGTLTLKLRLNQTGNTLHAKSKENGIQEKADFSTKHKTTISLAASFRGLTLALAVNPAKISGAYKDYELNANYFGSRVSLDFSYQRSESLVGDITSDLDKWRLEAGDAKMKVMNIAGYYIFNHRHFSYAAAFTQSYLQRRSAGSWLAGFSYQGGSIETTDKLEQRQPEASDLRLHTGHIGIGGGYGFNWVPGRRWLLHLSVLPTFVIINSNNLTIDGERQKAHRVHLNMMFNERAAIVYNFSPRYFAGATLVMNNSAFADDILVINQNKWRARFFVGMRL